MSGGRLPHIAGAVLAVAVLGALIRPVLSALDTHRADTLSTRAVPAPAAPAAVDAAVRAAAQAMACPPTRPRRADCGQLVVTRSAAYPSGATALVVLLIGTMHFPPGGTAPVALRVWLSRDASGWRPTVMSP